MSWTFPSHIPCRALAAAACALSASAALAQAPAAATAATEPIEPRVQRIEHEDALTRVSELRVAGQTRRITVQPKNGAPAYDVTPATGGEDPNTSRNGSTGKSHWRLLAF